MLCVNRDIASIRFKEPKIGMRSLALSNAVATGFE